MTAPLYGKILASVEENLFNLGYGNRAEYRWFGDVTPNESTILGNEIAVRSAVFNFTDNRYPILNDLGFIAVLRQDKVAGLTWNKAMTTQLHAYEQFAQAGAYAELFFQAPVLDTSAADPTSTDIALTKFIHDVVHVFRGQFGTRTDLYYTRSGEVPAITSIAGKDSAAESAVNFTKMASLLPYGRISVPGELA